MGRFLLLSVVIVSASGCYMSHQLGDRDGGCTPGSSRCYDGSLPMNGCVPGATQPVPCGRCGTASRVCGPSATWEAPGECVAERDRCPVDVMLLADITGSHTSFFRASEEALTTQLVEPLEVDADVRVGVSGFADYPVGGYGSAGDRPFIGVLAPTHDVTSVATAISTIMFLDGNDGPEAQIEGLNDLAGLRPHPTARPFMCPTGSAPGGCWRTDGGWKVIIVMTDVASHNLPDGHGGLVDPYGRDLLPPAPTWLDVRDALIGNGTYVYWIVPGGDSGVGITPESQARELATELGENPDEAVATYPIGTTDATAPVIATRLHVVSHFGIRVAP